MRTLGSVFFARGDTATPMWIAGAAVLLNVVLSLLLMGPLGHVGIAVATAIAAWVQAMVVLAVLVRRGQFAPDAQLCRRVAAIAAASLVMVGAVWLARVALGDVSGTDEASRAATLALLIAAGFASFGAVVVATRVVRLRDIARAWRSDPGEP